MAVSKLQNWQAVSTSSADPDNQTAVIASGTNRTMILVHSVENNGDFTASCAIGQVSATGRGQLFWESGGSQDLRVSYWYWDETAVAAMSATTSIQWSESVVLNGAAWTYGIFASTSAVVADTTVDSTVSSSQPLTIPTPGDTGDYTVVFGHRDTNNREFGTDGSLTEIYDVDVGGASRAGLFDGAWSSSVETIHGDDEVLDPMILAGIVIRQFNVAAVTSGSGAILVPNATADGVGERVVTGQGSATNTLALISATAERKITGTVGLSAPLAQVAGTPLIDTQIGTYERIVKIDDKDVAYRATLHSDPYNNIAPVADLVSKSVIIEGDYHASVVLRT